MDSISCEKKTALNAISDGEILFDGFGTSKVLDNPYYFPSLSLFARQESSRNAVIFNNGLHGWHLDEQSCLLYEPLRTIKCIFHIQRTVF